MSGECQSSVSIGEYGVPSLERGWMPWDNVSQTVATVGQSWWEIILSAGWEEL